MRHYVEELIAYSRMGNFDRVMAFMQLMFMVEEEYEQEVEEEAPKNMVIEFLLNNMTKMYAK